MALSKEAIKTARFGPNSSNAPVLIRGSKIRRLALRRSIWLQKSNKSVKRPFSSRSYTEGQENNVPYLHRQWLNGATEGIIALSGGCEGEIGQAL
ncbi:hypothetical protein QUF54_10100, partial [Candidatus Marithioploca araucensis]|nr:hypothetical protein [Candidatus Marithioploca araucensis]